MTTEKPANVRIATTFDEQAIFDLLTGAQGLYEENALFELSRRKVRSTIKDALARHQGQLGTPSGPKGIIGVIEHDGKIVGSIGMGFTSFWYTEEWHLSEFWNFVHPNHRKSSYALDLIQFAKWCADGLGIPLHMGIISRERVKGKVRLYKRIIPYVGGYFIYGIKGLEIDPIEEAA